MNDKDFYLKQQAAVERMREMNSKAQIKTTEVSKKPSAPTHINQQQNTASNLNHTYPENNQKSSGNTQVNKNGLNIPFLESLFRDGDSTLIVGLLLLLMSEKCDKLLLFALVYILL